MVYSDQDSLEKITSDIHKLSRNLNVMGGTSIISGLVLASYSNLYGKEEILPPLVGISLAGVGLITLVGKYTAIYIGERAKEFYNNKD